LTLSLPTTDEKNFSEVKNSSLTCEDVFANAGLNYSSFWHGAAHGIHSLSLEEIRYFFKADAKEDNKIPTVNIDFRSEKAIHFNAKLWGYEDRFDTWALKIMDWFMLNDHPYQYETGSNPLEKLSHQYHMHEIYSRAAKVYKELVKNPPKNTNLCSCANDVIANGILTEVVNIARQLKYRGSRNRQGRQSCCCGCTCSEKYREYGPKIKRCVELSKAPALSREKRATDGDLEEEINTLKAAYLKESTYDNAEKLLAVAPWIPGNFTGSDEWVSYSAMLVASLPNDAEIRDFATFIYCKLQEPDNDHPADLF